MAFDPGFPNIDEDAHLVENKARIKPDYSILSTDTFPTLASADAGRIIEHTDTGDRFRWTGAVIVPIYIAGKAIISDGGDSITVDTDSGPLAIDDSTPIEVNVQQPVNVSVNNFEDITDPLPIQIKKQTFETDSVIVLNEISRKLSVLIKYWAMFQKIDLEEDL